VAAIFEQLAAGSDRIPAAIPDNENNETQAAEAGA
jgi:hypothetical protein